MMTSDPTSADFAISGKPRFHVSTITTYVDHAKCAPDDHDRSLPDDAMRLFLTGEIRLAVDGLLGCNDDGLPLFWCHRDEQWWHVDPDAGCFLSPSWGVTCETHGLTGVTEEQRYLAPGSLTRFIWTLGCGCVRDSHDGIYATIR